LCAQIEGSSGRVIGSDIRWISRQRCMVRGPKTLLEIVFGSWKPRSRGTKAIRLCIVSIKYCWVLSRGERDVDLLFEIESRPHG
jgi:hypothetical protein